MFKCCKQPLIKAQLLNVHTTICVCVCACVPDVGGGRGVGDVVVGSHGNGGVVQGADELAIRSVQSLPSAQTR